MGRSLNLVPSRSVIAERPTATGDDPFPLPPTRQPSRSEVIEDVSRSAHTLA